MADPCPQCHAPTRDGVYRNDALLDAHGENVRLRNLIMKAAPTAWAHGADIDGAVAWEKDAAALLSKTSRPTHEGDE